MINWFNYNYKYTVHKLIKIKKQKNTMDKKVMYALIGGAAFVGAAVAYHFMSATEADPGLDEDLEQLGALELDGQGRIEFKQYLKIFQICSFYGKNQFNEKKKELITRRRQAFKDEDN